MQKGNSYTVGQWCDRWFCENQSRWSGSTVGGYRNLLYCHIFPRIGSIPLAEMSEDSVSDFYDSLRSQGLGTRSVWCVHLLLRRCMDEAAREQLILYNPVRLCQEPPAEENQELHPQGGAVPAGGGHPGAGARTAPGQPHSVPVAPHRRLLEPGRGVQDQPQAAGNGRHRGARALS